MTLALVMGSPRPFRIASDQASSFDPLGVSYSAVACGTRPDAGAEVAGAGVGDAGGGEAGVLARGGRAGAITGDRIIPASAPSGLPWFGTGVVVAGRS